MPNLAGIYDRELTEHEAVAKNDHQIKWLGIPGIDYHAHRFATDGFAAALLDNGILENGPQPVGAGSSQFRLFLDGEIYNARDIAKTHRLDCDRDLTDPLICLLLYEKLGIKFLSELNGLFAVVIYNTQTRELLLATDRFGFRPIFYRNCNNRLLFGSELKALSSIDNEQKVDELGLLELFSYGQHIEDRTWLSGYKRLRPGTFLQFGETGFQTEFYWRYAYDESAGTLDQKSYFTVYRSLMGKATERCMKGTHRIGVFLSGGYDSRAVAASIDDFHKPIPAFTFGEKDSRDVRFAADLAANLRIDHYVLSESKRSLADVCKPIVWRTEGMLPFIENTSIAFHSEIQKYVDIVLLGLLGEFGGSHTWPALLFSRTRDQVTRSMFARLTAARNVLIRRYFKREFLERTIPILRESFEQSFAKVINDHPLNLADSWNFMNFQPRGSFHAPATDRHQFEVRAPHMDADLVKFLLTIPPRSRIEQRVYKKMIAYGYPSIRSVPCTNSGRPINPNFASEYPTMVLKMLGRKSIDVIRRRSSKTVEVTRESSDISEKFRAEPDLLNKILLPMLEGGVFDAEIFDTDAISRILESSENLDREHTRFLSLLISWGLAAHFLLSSESDVVSDIDIFSRI